MKTFLPRHGISLVAFVVGAATLIATSKSPMTVSAEEIAEAEFLLNSGEQATYRAQISHADLSDSGFINLYARVSVSPLKEETTLLLALESEDDTGMPATESAETVPLDGVGLIANGSYDLNTSPLITLTAGKGGVEGVLSVDVIVEWYGDLAGGDTGSLVSVELVEVE